MKTAWVISEKHETQVTDLKWLFSQNEIRKWQPTTYQYETCLCLGTLRTAPKGPTTKLAYPGRRAIQLAPAWDHYKNEKKN